MEKVLIDITSINKKCCGNELYGHATYLQKSLFRFFEIIKFTLKSNSVATNCKNVVIYKEKCENGNSNLPTIKH